MVVVDDQALVRAGFRMIPELEADLEVVGEAADDEQSVEQLPSCGPTFVPINVRMPGADGIAATRRVLGDGGGRARVVMPMTFYMDQYV